MYRTENASSGASRRGFLKAAGALVIATYVDFARSGEALALTRQDGPMPNVFIKIGADDKVTVLIKHLDKGQGIATGLSTIVADELDADWAQIVPEFAPANAALYNNLTFGPVQATGGSSSVNNSWTQMRLAGAAARAMLITAAADTWKVPPGEITITKGVIAHAASGHSGRFGEFAAKAAALPVPAGVKPKDPKDWVYIGKAVPRLDTPAKTTGQTIYAFDFKRPGMLTAVIKRPPKFGATVKSVDAAATRAVPGVVDIVQVPQGVAVLARDTYSALKGRRALQVTWDETKAETRSSDAILSEYRTLASGTGLPALRRVAATAPVVKSVEAEFTMPYLAHAPMEPLNATMEVKPDGAVEIWAGSQFQTVEQMVVAGIFGIKPDQVTINTLWAGGSFGRRATPNGDYVAELAQIVKTGGRKEPIHLVWTREDDLAGGRYRPASLHRVRAGLDANGHIVAWDHHVVNQSFMIGTMMAGPVVKDGVDRMAVEGVIDLPYAVPTVSLEWHQATSPVTTLWWRSVGHSHTAQAVETMIDMAAAAGGRDPLALRLELLKDEPRYTGVLKLAAEKAGYGEKLPPGRGRGIAVHESFKTLVAMVADVTVKDNVLKVDRIVAAVDCGVPINPDVIRAQMEGGAGYGLGAALRNKITFANGVVEQGNFDTYEPLRMSDMPRIEVHIVPSMADPTGVGEPGVPPVAPAVTNAIFNATGKWITNLPWDLTANRGA